MAWVIGILIVVALAALAAFLLLRRKSSAIPTGPAVFVAPLPFPDPNAQTQGTPLVQGKWSSTTSPIQTSSPSVDFVWFAFKVDQLGGSVTDAVPARAIHFVLTGNPKVKIVAISNGGQVESDGRSGIGASGADGLVTVSLKASFEDLSSGSLWGIDEMLPQPAGAEAKFEVH